MTMSGENGEVSETRDDLDIEPFRPMAGLHVTWLRTEGRRSLCAFLALVDVVVDEAGRNIRFKMQDPLDTYTPVPGDRLSWPLWEQLEMMLGWKAWTADQLKRFQDILTARRKIMAHGQAPVDAKELDALTVELAGLIYDLRQFRRSF